MKHIIGAASGKAKRPAQAPAHPKVTAAPPKIGPLAAPKAPESAATPVQATLVTVEEDYAGQRLDNFLIRQLKGVPN